MFSPGDEIDIWKVEQALGSGGMGSVYRCHNRSARRILAAIKVLDKGLQRHASIRARFIREAEILFKLDHPNIVKVRNIRIDSDPPYLEMEFVEGTSLEARLEKGAMPIQEALHIAAQLADALAYLHPLGIRHRDIKPSNILVQPDGTVKLVDFGIATESDGSTLAEGGQVFGSVAFVPPEWVQPGRLDPALWDIYALGVCLFEAITGRIAFPVPSHGSPSQRFFQVITAKQNHAPLDPGPGFSPSLRRLIQGMTHSDISQRTASAAHVRDQLREHLQHPPNPTIAAGTAPPLPPAPPAPPLWRRPLLPALLGLPLIGLLAWAGIPLLLPDRPPEPRQLQVHLSGIGDLAVALTLDDLPPVSTPAAAAGGYTFLPLMPGAHRLAARIGSGCEQKPALCGSVQTTVEIPPGAGPHPFSWSIPAPPPRTLQLTASKIGAVRVSISGTLVGEGSLLSATALPGSWPVHAESAACPPSPSCTPACPPGCTVYDGFIDVPWGEGAMEIDLPMAPAPAAATAIFPPVAGTPAAPPTPAGPPPLISNRQLSRWLSSHPEWLSGGARAAGAIGTLLNGWDGATPPPGKESHAANNVSWALASAYCAGRGGLSDADAPPLRWQESATNPWHEFRQQGGKPAWRRSDGTVSLQVVPEKAAQLTGIRCAR